MHHISLEDVPGKLFSMALYLKYTEKILVVLLESFLTIRSHPFVKSPINFTLNYTNVELHKCKMPQHLLRHSCGPDGTRTRDLRRDRAAF